MSYVTKTLGHGEQVIYRAQFNWTYSFAAWLWLLISTVPLGIYGALAVSGSQMETKLLSPLSILPFGALVAGGIIFIQRITHIITTEIVFTNLRLIMKTGWLSRKSHEVSVANIEEVTFQQSLLGRLLGYGEIIVRGTGVGEIKLPPLGHPLEIQRHLDDARAALRALRTESAN